MRLLPLDRAMLVKADLVSLAAFLLAPVHHHQPRRGPGWALPGRTRAAPSGRGPRAWHTEENGPNGSARPRMPPPASRDR